MKLSKRQRQRTAAIFKRAARNIETGYERLGCLAISRECHKGRANYDTEEGRLEFFGEVFGKQTGRVWFGNHSKENQDKRVLLLCLAAAIAETGGL